MTELNWTVAHQAPLSMEFSKQEYWSGLPCPSRGDLPNAGIKLDSLVSLQVDSLPLSYQRNPDILIPYPNHIAHYFSMKVLSFLGKKNGLIQFEEQQFKEL